MIATCVDSDADDNIHTDRGDTVPSNRLVEDLKRAHDVGFSEGLQKGRQELVDWLQNAYLADDAPLRGTPEAEAILTLAREASKHFRSLVEPIVKAKKR